MATGICWLLAAAAPPPAPEIVVTGRTRTEAQAVRALTRGVTRMSDGQVARFTGSVCVRASGLAPELDPLVAARVTAAAQAVGLRIEGEGCRPNLSVLFVEDGRATLAALRKQSPGLFRQMPPGANKRLFDEPGAVRVLQLTEVRSRDGDRESSMPPAGVRLRPDVKSLEVRTASIINEPTRQDITDVIVLIDRPRTENRTVRQLGDYAAMRGLAVTQTARVGEESSSILSLFDRDPAAAPRGLTPFDDAYLAGLYHGLATRPGIAKVNDIARAINKRGVAARQEGEATR